MLVRLRFAVLAELELDEATAYYEMESPGLGLRFAREVYQVILHAMQFPHAGTAIRDSRLTRQVRYYRLNPAFPYDVIASVVNEDELLVVALAHQKREPVYWLERTGLESSDKD